MKQGPLIGVQACVFDAYGTLFDFAAAARGCRDVLGDSIDKLTTLWRDKQLQYTWLRAVQGRHADFWQVTGDGVFPMSNHRETASFRSSIDPQPARPKLADTAIRTSATRAQARIDILLIGPSSVGAKSPSTMSGRRRRLRARRRELCRGRRVLSHASGRETGAGLRRRRAGTIFCFVQLSR